MRLYTNRFKNIDLVEQVHIFGPSNIHTCESNISLIRLFNLIFNLVKPWLFQEISWCSLCCAQYRDGFFHLAISGYWYHMPCSGGSRISRWGGRRPVVGGTNLQCVHFLAKTYAKTKEMDPVGGACAGGAPLDPPMHGKQIMPLFP